MARLSERSCRVGVAAPAASQVSMDSSRCPGWYRQQGLFLHKGEVPTVYADKPEAGLPDSPHSRGDPLPRRRLIELHAKDRWTDEIGRASCRARVCQYV